MCSILENVSFLHCFTYTYSNSCSYSAFALQCKELIATESQNQVIPHLYFAKSGFPSSNASGKSFSILKYP